MKRIFQIEWNDIVLGTKWLTKSSLEHYLIQGSNTYDKLIEVKDITNTQDDKTLHHDAECDGEY
jgi:hypothetical protein